MDWFYEDVQKAFDDFLNDNDIRAFCDSLNETLIQYRIENKEE